MRAPTASALRRRRPGYALLVVLALIVTVMLAAIVLLPGTGAATDAKRIDIAYDVLDDLTNDINQGITHFHNEIGKYPADLQQLRSEITGSQTSLCGTSYTDRGKDPDTDLWGAPYIYRELVSNQLFVGIGWAQNTFAREPPTGTPNTLIIRVLDVDARDASRLNARVDTLPETTPSAEGTVRWGSPDATGRVELHWRRAVTC